MPRITWNTVYFCATYSTRLARSPQISYPSNTTPPHRSKCFWRNLERWACRSIINIDAMEFCSAETASGRIQGLISSGVRQFKGVPYGASTAGANRFQRPKPATPWTGVRDSFGYAAVSPQVPYDVNHDYARLIQFDLNVAFGGMGEDCLHLNIWTPGTGRQDKRAVLFCIHGGGFAICSGSHPVYDGAKLARLGDVVVVTVTHRLASFGFVNLADLEGTGRWADAGAAGMLDLVTALEWVRDNIEAFGGDPNSVTIFGQSGGGWKVSALMAMPSAKGLFHRAIVESGADVRGVPTAAGTKSAEAFMAKLGLQPNQVDQLQALPMDQLLTTMGSMTGGGAPGVGGLALAPVVDGKTLPTNPFDPTAPELSANVPLLIGTTETEVTFFPGQILDPIDAADLHTRVKQTLRAADDSQVDDLIAVYRKDRPDATNTDLYLIIASDATFRAGVLVEADRKAQQDKAPCYQYYFTWRSPVRDGKLRSFHTLEIPFVF